MTPSIEGRREAAGKLSGIAVSTSVNWLKLMGALGVNSREGALLRLCELVDPTAWENTVEDNHRLLDRCRELEAENVQLKAHMENRPKGER